MIEMHAHILPGFDHGPNTMNESLEMARQAAAAGVSIIYATPRYRYPSYDFDAVFVTEAVKFLNFQLLKARIPVRVRSGQEITLYDGMETDLERKRILPLEHTNYVLVNMNGTHSFLYVRQMLKKLYNHGFIPILSSPERLRMFQKRHGGLEKLVNEGAAVQISAGALLGRDGRSDRRWAKYFIKKRLVHFVASNACSAYDQPFCLDQAYWQFVRMQRLGEWERMQKNTHLLLNGGRITPPAKQSLI
ncbi:tyrosine-protein phosphatase [Marinococcus luteus]|uniref:tyrosine-protein phosphatase n=1 Tax=Marinococcus luteus TaxID=1122204 RepID=UPI002ACCEFE6|nr:CpsB/CapC family capsule biosynthesis tyrosine phosphatase [Marinococcus luteus]MDZ5784228.1 CpsB/CapC family capsule biosynthesis tyrosine phosphatase [Marinococcus luteus]